MQPKKETNESGQLQAAKKTISQLKKQIALQKQEYAELNLMARQVEADRDKYRAESILHIAKYREVLERYAQSMELQYELSKQQEGNATRKKTYAQALKEFYEHHLTDPFWVARN